MQERCEAALAQDKTSEVWKDWGEKEEGVEEGDLGDVRSSDLNKRKEPATKKQKKNRKELSSGHTTTYALQDE